MSLVSGYHTYLLAAVCSIIGSRHLISTFLAMFRHGFCHATENGLQPRLS